SAWSRPSSGPNRPHRMWQYERKWSIVTFVGRLRKFYLKSPCPIQVLRSKLLLPPPQIPIFKGGFMLYRLCSVLLCFGVAASTGCTRAAWQAAAQGAATGAAPAQAPSALLVFGGSDHKTFLGCLNCSEYGQSSIKNQYSFGSPYGHTIFNHFSEYGSEFSSDSACNP